MMKNDEGSGFSWAAFTAQLEDTRKRSASAPEANEDGSSGKISPDSVAEAGSLGGMGVFSNTKGRQRSETVDYASSSDRRSAEILAQKRMNPQALKLALLNANFSRQARLRAAERAENEATQAANLASK